VSLLDRARHWVLVEPAVVSVGAYNEQVVSYGAAVRVPCAVQPLRAEEAVGLGVTADTAYKVIARDWPGSLHSRVTWLGRTWFQHGETLHHTMSPRTQHDVAIIEAADAEVR
jgi:hypothetical protein